MRFILNYSIFSLLLIGCNQPNGMKQKILKSINVYKQIDSNDAYLFQIEKYDEQQRKIEQIEMDEQGLTRNIKKYYYSVISKKYIYENNLEQYPGSYSTTEILLDSLGLPLEEVTINTDENKVYYKFDTTIILTSYLPSKNVNKVIKINRGQSSKSDTTSTFYSYKNSKPSKVEIRNHQLNSFYTDSLIMINDTVNIRYRIFENEIFSINITIMKRNKPIKEFYFQNDIWPTKKLSLNTVRLFDYDEFDSLSKKEIYSLENIHFNPQRKGKVTYTYNYLYY